MNYEKLLEDIKKLSLASLRGIYHCNHLKGITINLLIETLKKSTLGFNFLINEKMDQSLINRKPFYLLKIDNKYEVFGIFDRGGKECVEEFMDIEQAIFDLLDRYLNELGYAAPDSKINS